MDFGRFLSVRKRKPTQESSHGGHGGEVRHHLPLIKSPISEDLRQSLGSNGFSSIEKLKSRPVSMDTMSTTSTGSPIIYKTHHEASTIELFYDLFFVANLAYFTAMHQHVDAESVLNYLKLFTLLWFTWLSTILFDVRFVADSVWQRFCKLVHFGVMAGFTFAGPVFDAMDKVEDQRYYKAFALVMFTSRLIIAIQYLVVMFQSRMVKKALLPLGLTAGIYIATATVFLVTHFAFPATGPITWFELFIWFILSIAEGITTLLIAIFFRIISFKYTHLVERMGLLTLILIGEGIIGMVKSVACVTKGQLTNNGSEIGTVIAAVILLYFLWMLYFDQIEHHRFGTIRQQVWAILHFPLHVAILLTVEGQTSLIVWNSVVQGLKKVWALRPLPENNPAQNFATSQDFINAFNASMTTIDKHFKSASWKSAYPWTDNLTAIANYTATYGYKTDQWNSKVAELTNKTYIAASVFIFEAHKETLDKVLAIFPNTKDPANTQDTLDKIYAVFDIVTLYFFVCAGGILLVLAMLYWFGKLHKTKYEFGEMINRTLIGFIIPIVGVVATLTNKSETGFKFAASQWLIPMVVFGYLIVLVLDNILMAFAHLTDKRKSMTSRWSGGTYIRSPQGDEEDDRTPMVDDRDYKLSNISSNRVSSSYSRDTTYQPYDAPAGALSSQHNTPEIGLPHSRNASQDNSRAPSPAPPQIPVSMIMQNNFRPSHTRTRSAGYAAVGGDDHEDAEHGYVNNALQSPPLPHGAHHV